MKYITIPSSVTPITSNPFVSCTNLKFIKVSDGNANYSNVTNGIFYYKIFTFIICYPAGIQSPTFVIPNTVKSLAEFSFYLCSSFKNLTIPSSVTLIGNSTLRDCSSLEIVTIGEYVETIGDDEFYSF